MRELTSRMGRRRPYRPVFVGEAILKFHENSLSGHSRQGGFRADYSSHFDGKIVFPDKRLEKLIKQRSLCGMSVKVCLKEVHNHSNNRLRLVAFLPRDRHLTVMRPLQKWQQCRQPIVIIDGNNFFLSLRTIVHEGGRLDAADAVRGALDGLGEISEIHLFVCSQWENQFLAEIDELQRAFGNKLKIISKKAERRHDKKGFKLREDADNDIIDLLHRKTSNGFAGSELLVMFSGDHHFAGHLRNWWLHPGDTQPRSGRQLIIVGSQIRDSRTQTGSLSKDMRELANDPNARLILLEHLT